MSLPYTSNDEHPFEPGELVQQGGCTYVVEANHGDHGAVGCYASGARIEPFYWAFDGSVTRRLGRRVRFSRPQECRAAA